MIIRLYSMIIRLHSTIVFIAIIFFGFANSNNQPSFSQFCNVSNYNFKVCLGEFFVAIIQPRSQGVLPFSYFNRPNLRDNKAPRGQENHKINDAYKISQIKKVAEFWWDKLSCKKKKIRERRENLSRES